MKELHGNDLSSGLIDLFLHHYTRLLAKMQRFYRKHVGIEPFFRTLARWMIKTLYRVDMRGFEQIPTTGGALLIANHVSYMDGVVIQAACSRPIRFVIDKDIYNLPGINFFMVHNGAIPIAPTKEDVTKALDDIAQGLQEGDLICIFPEGQLTYTGHLGRFKPGVEWIISRSPVPVYPIALKGLWGSFLSRKYRKEKYHGFMKEKLRRKVSVRCGEVINPAKVSIDSLQRVILSLLRKP